MIAKLPKPIKVLFLHAISLAIIAGVSLQLVTQHLSGAGPGITQPALHFFIGIYFLGALALGTGSALRPIFLIGVQLLRKGDLNNHSTREEIGLLIFFVLEICLAVAILFFSGFVKIHQ